METSKKYSSCPRRRATSASGSEHKTFAPRRLVAADFDATFGRGKVDIIDRLDLDHMRRPSLTPKRVNVDFPAWMVSRLDREASRLGITRQSLIKMWLSERLENRGQTLSRGMVD